MAGHKNFLDWSRDARRQRVIEATGSDQNQSLIEDYVFVIDEIEQLTNENKILCDLVKTINEQLKHESKPTSSSFTSFPIMLQHLIKNAEKNAVKAPKGRRHLEVIKKFAISLFIYTGPMAYKFLQQNITLALPSLRTIQSQIYSEYRVISEGEFRFDELSEHLKRYELSGIVTIGEDATCVISRVEYDSQTNRCVGFVLPIDENGLPIIESFLATSYERIENMFSTCVIAKYAYVYMVKPLDLQSPSFCLGCVGTDNKFSAEMAIMRWNYIVDECKKRNIHVISFGGDGDSRLMRAMQISTGLMYSSSASTETVPTSTLKSPCIPELWNSWFYVKHPSAITYVQDTVHIAVKLKTRLLKHSLIMPLGNYIVAVQHLQLLHENLPKEQHKLRERDIDCKDKQNFDAVINIIQASPYLEKIPDALGTKMYIDMIQNIVESYLDKTLHPLQRIEKIWFSLYFYAIGVAGFLFTQSILCK